MPQLHLDTLDDPRGWTIRFDYDHLTKTWILTFSCFDGHGKMTDEAQLKSADDPDALGIARALRDFEVTWATSGPGDAVTYLRDHYGAGSYRYRGAKAHR